MMVRPRGRDRQGSCPGCGCPPARVHDRYRRQLQDVSLAVRRVQILLEVRRFSRCPSMRLCQTAC
ncbi:transposase family protein [Streptomyces sp. NPDC090083]|uniref:transposase family protein n=1 Tax=Streptomyces sp. NPDC090083 TaxID=3365941 RepID=UPI0037F32BCE